MRGVVGLNTDLFETNILNLSVVVGIVGTVVLDAFRTLLRQRRQIVLFALQESDRKARDRKKRLEDARDSVEVARKRAQEIRIQTAQSIERENRVLRQKLTEDLKALQTRTHEAIQLERQQIVRGITSRIVSTALSIAESTLLSSLRLQRSAPTKQKELNDVHVRETLRRLRD